MLQSWHGSNLWRYTARFNFWNNGTFPGLVVDHILKSTPTRHPFRLPAPAIRALIAVAALALTVWAEWMPPTGLSLFGNEVLRDTFVRVRATDAPEPRVLVVDIDEASLAKLGPWPWPHSRMADLVETLLGRYESRGVALDILLPEAGDALGDARLAALAQHGPLVLAQAFDYDFAHLRPQALHAGVLAGGHVQDGRRSVSATGYLANHAGLAQARQVGNIGFIPDPDGVLRRVPMQTRDRKSVV